MTREEKIKQISSLADVNIPKYDITNYKLSDEELHIRTIKELEKLTDEELDIVIDKIWDAINDLAKNILQKNNFNIE